MRLHECADHLEQPRRLVLALDGAGRVGAVLDQRDRFRTYVYLAGITPSKATGWNWNINWIAHPKNV